MRRFNFLLFILFSISLTYAQVGINTASPNESAILDVASNEKGVLFPRMDLGDLNQSAPVTNPATGLIVWNTDAVSNGARQGLYLWEGSSWAKLSTGAATATTSSSAYAEIKLGATASFNVTNNVQKIPGATANKTVTTNSSITSADNNLSFTSASGGLFKLTYTLTYQYNFKNGAVEFFILNGNNVVTGSEVMSVEKTEIDSLTVTKILNLTSGAIYTLGLRSTGAKNGDNINIYSKQTNIVLEAL